MPALRLVERGAAVVRPGLAIVETRMDAPLETGIVQGEVSERHHERDHARADVEIALPCCRRCLAFPKTSGRKERPAIATSAPPEPGAPRRQAIPRTYSHCQVRPEGTLLRLCSDQNPHRAIRHSTRLIRSRRRRDYDSAGRPCPLDPSGGDAASRVQAVTPITTAPTTAKTCRQRSDVMVRPESPNAA